MPGLTLEQRMEMLENRLNALEARVNATVANAAPSAAGTSVPTLTTEPLAGIHSSMEDLLGFPKEGR